MHNILNRVRFWFLGQSTRGWFWVCRSNGMDTSFWKDDANICIHYDIFHSIVRSSGEQRIIIIHDCSGNNQITKVKSPWEIPIFQPILIYIFSTHLYCLWQISIRPNRTLAFCNKDRWIADDTKQFELRREKFEGEHLTPDQSALADELETEQVRNVFSNQCTQRFFKIKLLNHNLFS